MPSLRRNIWQSSRENSSGWLNKRLPQPNSSRLRQTHVNGGQAFAGIARRRETPTAPKPSSSIAQVAGSGITT